MMPGMIMATKTKGRQSKGEGKLKESCKGKLLESKREIKAMLQQSLENDKGMIKESERNTK